MPASYRAMCVAAVAIAIAVTIAAAPSLPTPQAWASDGPVLWVPEQMIAGHKYHGVVVLPDASKNGSLVLLSSTSDLVDVPESTYVSPMSNHGVFPVTPAGSAEAEIFATVQGRLHSSPVRAFSDSSSPGRLGLVLPSDTTRADSMTAYVAVLDENGLPALLQEDLAVALATSGALDAPAGLTVAGGTFYESFRVGVRGPGSVIASAHGLEPARAEVQKLPGSFTVRVGVAPSIAMPDSYVHYYVWLEKDGRPFDPPKAVRAFLHSDNPGVARTHAGPSYEPDGLPILLVDGIARGLLYTGDPGEAAVSASVPGFGLGQDVLVVGSAGIGDVDLPGTGLPGTGLPGTDPPGIGPPRTGLDPGTEESGTEIILSWVYPEVTDDTAWGVAAIYSLEEMPGQDAEDAGRDDAGGSSSQDSPDEDAPEDTVLVPSRLDGRTMYVSSGTGLGHRDAYVMKEQLVKTNAVEFEISGLSHGSHDISMSGQGMRPSHSTVGVSPGYEKGFGIRIAGLPALAGTTQDLAMISVVDGAGAMVDAADAFGRDVSFQVSSESGAVQPGRLAPNGSGSAVLRGELHGPERITAILDGVGSASADMSPAGIATSLDLLMPPTVHIGEEFPFAVHEVDMLGIPTGRVESLRVSTPLDLSVGRHMALGSAGTGTVSVVSDKGAASTNITGFANRMDVEIELDRTELRVGEDVRLDIFNTVDADYALTTDHPFRQVGDSTFVITADHEDESVISVLATLPGYEPAVLSAELSVLHIYLMDIRATDADGARVYPGFDVRIGTEKTSAVPPYHVQFRPDAVEVSFPQKHASETDGYSFGHMLVNGKPYHESRLVLDPDGDLDIVVVYDREVLISVADADGSGVYKKGDPVTVRAPERQVLSFLVRDVFDYWVGLGAGHDSAEETFVAESNMDIAAVYRTDYTYLLAMVAAPLLAGSILAMLKMTSGLRWLVQNALETLASAVRPKKTGPNSESADSDSGVRIL